MKRKHVLAMISPVSAQRIAGIAQFAKEHNWNLLIMDRLGHHPVAWNGDGILATIRSDSASVKQIKAFVERGIPVVDLTTSRPDVKVPRVTSDHAEIGRLAARHFLERHFTNFAWFSTSWGNVHRIRFNAFAKICGKKPLRWVADETLPHRQLGEWEPFRDWLKESLSTCPKPIAVLCYDETDAARLLYVAQEIGIDVPEELAILSIGNDPIICENQTVPLSSIDQNLFRGGYEAAAMLEEIMDGTRSKSRSIPPGEVIARRSTDAIAIADPVIRAAIKYITNNLDKPLGSPQIAAALNLPRFRLDELFRRTLAHSVGEEIRRMRMAKAKDLLTNSDLSIGEIAAATGFCSCAHLSNAFKAVYGLTPSAWRTHTSQTPNPKYRLALLKLMSSTMPPSHLRSFGISPRSTSSPSF